jgi:hypothetical protein
MSIIMQNRTFTNTGAVPQRLAIWKIMFHVDEGNFLVVIWMEESSGKPMNLRFFVRLAKLIQSLLRYRLHQD